jgi:CMP-N,N'-diacetyllegionaminic acid synthase
MMKEKINKPKILAVVPARGGSKGIKGKNLKKLQGKSLVAKCGHVLKDIDQIDLAIVSTDSEDIAEEARLNGLQVPFLRPERLSGDLISDIEVLQHALEEAERFQNITFDIILMIQPTSPMRHKSDILEVLDKIQRGGFDSVFTVSETDSKGHPLKQFVLDDDSINYFDARGKKIIARQQLKPTYHKNGLAYAVTRRCLIEQKTLLGENASYVCTQRPTVNIDTPSDLQLAHFFLSELDEFGSRK